MITIFCHTRTIPKCLQLISLSDLSSISGLSLFVFSFFPISNFASSKLIFCFSLIQVLAGLFEVPLRFFLFNITSIFHLLCVMFYSKRSRPMALKVFLLVSYFPDYFLLVAPEVLKVVWDSKISLLTNKVTAWWCDTISFAYYCKY